MDAEQRLRLNVSNWAAILTRDAVRQELGDLAATHDIPAALRRRSPPFVRDVLRCGLKLLQGASGNDLVFCSGHGDLAATVQLLSDISARTPLSPAQFSLSVHNAPAGLLGQALGRASDHTAIAGGEWSLSAGLTEAYARLATQDGGAIVLIFADVALPAIYQDYDLGGPDVHLGLRLEAALPEKAGHLVMARRHGAAALALALAQGERTLAFSPPCLAGPAP